MAFFTILLKEKRSRLFFNRAFIFSALFIFSLFFLCLFLFSPLFNVGFFDEDDWYHLSFGQRIVEQGFFEADIVQMLVSSPELANEHIRMLVGLQYYWAAAYKIFGDNSRAHHILAFIIFFLCVLLAYIIAYMLSQKVTTATVATLIFALFPLNCRYVASAFTVVYPLLTFFFLFSVAFYIDFLKTSGSKDIKGRRQAISYLLSILFFAAAILTQEASYGLPVTLLLLDLIFSNKDKSGRFIRALKHLKIKNPILRTAPFFLLLISLVQYTTSLAYEHLKPESLDSGYFDFVAIPFYKLFSYLPGAFILPLYNGYAWNAGSVIFLVLVLILIFAVIAGSWKSRNKPLLIIAFGWIVINSLPFLQVLDKVQIPQEGEDRYLLLPLFGFAFLLAQATMPEKFSRKGLKTIRNISLISLMVFYIIALWGNSRFFIDKGARYESIKTSLELEMEKDDKAKTVLFLYQDHQQLRELILSAFLEYTFEKDENHFWYFIDRSMVLPFPITENQAVSFDDLTIASEPRGLRKSQFKFPSFFSKVTLSMDGAIMILGTEIKTSCLTRVDEAFLKKVENSLPPKVTYLEEFVSNGFAFNEKAIPFEGTVDRWVLKGFVYQVFPRIGRF